MKSKVLFTLLSAALFGAAPVFSQAFIDVEAGAAFPGYNDVRIPAEGGTPFSLVDDLSSDPAFALRVRVGYTFARRHTLSLLAAPLTVRGGGSFDRDVSYAGETFAAGSAVASSYRFDSYRLTYRYAFHRSESLSLALGLTGKLRSADIALMGDDGYASRDDLGVVPLINFLAEWRFAGPFGLLLEADALASPYGRAEDALLALQYRPAPNVAFRIGYRILEGGSDGGGDVYSFALFHYLTAGGSVSW